MKRPLQRCSALFVISLFAGGLRAEEPQMVTTRHQIHADGKLLSYTARAGLIPIRNNDAGDVHANIFYVEYRLDPAAGQGARPLTFVWNGGPGANSTLVHLVAFGPRRVRSNDDPTAPSDVIPRIEDNDATWLDFTDLVFVDPAGTGFSRPAKAEYGAEFYSTLGDIASIAEFVRVFRTRFDAFDAPLFLAGESYGTWRASGVAEALERKGTHVAGVMLLSGGIQMGPVSPDAVRTALFVPSRTATAFFHKRLAAELMRDQQTTIHDAERWALEQYAPAWDRRDSLSEPERDRIIGQLARYTGVETSAIDRKSLMMTSPQFTSALLPARKLGRYDMRILGTGRAVDEGARDLVMMRYLREELGFKSDLAYQGNEEGFSPGARAPSIGSRWSWDQLKTGDVTQLAHTAVGSGDGPPPAQPWLRRAMMLDPQIKVFLAAGLYDSLNSCADNRYLAAHVQPSEFGRNITLGCYGAGHMMYDTKAARYELKRDAAAFVERASRTAHAAAR